MRFKLPKSEFLRLIDSISMDVPNPVQAPRLSDFYRYCRGVAGVPGSLSLRIFGCNDEKMIEELSSSLGNALQITNILRDVKEDALSNRLYIPREFLQKAEITATDPRTVVTDKNLAIAREELAKIANEAYGSTEASLIFDNGDPVADMLYTTNFAFVGLCEAAKATNDSTYVKAVNQMRDFLIRIQVKSDKFRNVDGAWFRAFNYQDWNYWAANADAGWGAWSTLTGWIQSWIVGTQFLMEKNTSLWELSNRKDISKTANKVIEEMINNNNYK